MNIRLEHDWHLKLWQSRNALELDGYLTVKGLAERVEADRSWVYRRIYDGTISSSHVFREPQSKVYLIKDDPELIEQLRQRLERNRHT